MEELQIVLLLSIIVLLIIVGTVAGNVSFKKDCDCDCETEIKHELEEIKEEFSPLGFASNCPEFPLPKTNLKVEGCGPGCWRLQKRTGSRLKENKNNTETQEQPQKENFKVDGKRNGSLQVASRNCTTDRIPKIPEQLPIGHMSTMGSPLLGQAMCSSNVNGVQKFSNKNPYGKLLEEQNGDYNQFTQSYAACEFGANNIFDKDMLQF